MNIQDAPAICRDKRWTKQPHVTREADEVNFLFLERGDHKLVIRLALKPPRRNHLRRNPPPPRLLDPRRILAIADDDGNFRVGYAPGGYAIRQRLKVRTAPRQQHSDAFLRHRRKLA